MQECLLKTVVRVEIRDKNESNLGAGKPNLVSKFFIFTREHDIAPACKGGSYDEKLHIGYYSKTDAERIRVWLERQKVKVRFSE